MTLQTKCLCYRNANEKDYFCAVFDKYTDPAPPPSHINQKGPRPERKEEVGG